MSQEAAKIWQFFRLPNPRILTLFIISSTTSFSLGIAMIVQWVLHGQYHQGFHWMIYSASAITSLPILIWIIFMLFAICSQTSPLSSNNKNLSKSQQTLTRDQQQYTDTEAAAATTTTTQDEGPAKVQTEVQTAVRKSPMPFSQPTKRTDDNKQALKRTMSLPFFHVHTEYYVGSNLRRSRSLKQ